MENLFNSPAIVVLVTLFASLVTGIVTWLLGRRKSEAEITEISTRVYNTLVEDLEERVKRQSDTIVEQDKKICRQDDKYEKIILYVERLEDLLIENEIIKRVDLEAIRASLGI